MTKFEEEFKALTSWEWINVDLIQRILTKFGNWHSDEEYQELLKGNNKLKSQIQHQPLPVVPEFVGEFIESYKDRRTIYGVFDKISKNQKTYPKLYEWVFEDENSQATFALAFITGKYEVKKPQLFYLKNKLTTSYLILDTSTGYFEHWGSTEATGRYKSSFTKQEIGSMQTGSYEQIKVEEEK